RRHLPRQPRFPRTGFRAPCRRRSRRPSFPPRLAPAPAAPPGGRSSSAPVRGKRGGDAVIFVILGVGTTLLLWLRPASAWPYLMLWGAWRCSGGWADGCSGGSQSTGSWTRAPLPHARLRDHRAPRRLLLRDRPRLSRSGRAASSAARPG